MDYSRKKFGKQLEKVIRSKYPTVEKFAYENGISKQTVSHIINGNRDPKLSTILKITEALEIPIQDLL